MPTNDPDYLRERAHELRLAEQREAWTNTRLRQAQDHEDAGRFAEAIRLYLSLAGTVTDWRLQETCRGRAAQLKRVAAAGGDWSVLAAPPGRRPR